MNFKDSTAKRITLIFILSFICLYAQAQTKELKPYSITPLSYTAQGEKEFNEKMDSAKVLRHKMDEESIKYEDLSAEEQELIDFSDFTDDNYYSVSDPENIWQSCVTPREITASSYATSKDVNAYKPENVYDLDLRKTWAVQTKDSGIGEFITYYFNACTPRITNVFVVSGEVESLPAWNNSRRVKKLQMYVDNEPHAILLLEDSRSIQAFKFSPIGYSCADNRKTEPKDWSLKFEILEVYGGKKRSNTTIAAIYFDGIDVRCLAKGSLVIMANGSAKPIEELQIGDEVKSYDFENYQPRTAAIEQLDKVVHTHMVKYVFSNGKEITATPDHPFMVRAKGWSSMKPEQTKQYKGYKTVNEIKVGDQFFTINKSGTLSPITLTKVEEIHEEQETYTIAKLSAGNNFLVENFIVGVEELEE